MLKHFLWRLPVLSLSIAGCSHPAAPVAAEQGAQLFDRNCVACHQQDARGIPGVYPSLVGSPVLLGEPRALSRWVVQGRRPATLPQGRYSTVMVKFDWMKPSDAAALLTYVRTHFGNSAPPIDAPSVAQALEQ
jgi:mono/diheme cytochrome c family protein